MSNKYKTPLCEVSAPRPSGEFVVPALSAWVVGHGRTGGSVRELERIASHLRLIGEHRVSERIELKVLSLLEQKITRKLVASSRRY